MQKAPFKRRGSGRGCGRRGGDHVPELRCGDVDCRACGVRAALRELELHTLAQRVTGCAGILRGEVSRSGGIDKALRVHF